MWRGYTVADDLARIGIHATHSGVVDADRALDHLAGTAGRAERGVNRLSAEAAAMNRSFNQLKGVITLVFAGAAANDIMRRADEMTQLNNRLQLYTSTMAETAQVERDVFAAAQETRTSIAALGDLYASTAQNADQLNLSHEEILRLTTTVSKAFRISGADAQTAANAVRQFGQAMASGELRGDEFRAITENAPRLARAIADATGSSIGELRKLSKEGKLTAEVVTQAVLLMERDIDEEFDSIQVTFAEARIYLGNSITYMVDRIGDLTGAGETIPNVFIFAGDAIKSFVDSFDPNRIDDFTRSLERNLETMEWAEGVLERIAEWDWGLPRLRFGEDALENSGQGDDFWAPTDSLLALNRRSQRLTRERLARERERGNSMTTSIMRPGELDAGFIWDMQEEIYGPGEREGQLDLGSAGGDDTKESAFDGEIRGMRDAVRMNEALTAAMGKTEVQIEAIRMREDALAAVRRETGTVTADQIRQIDEQVEAWEASQASLDRMIDVETTLLDLEDRIAGNEQLIDHFGQSEAAIAGAALRYDLINTLKREHGELTEQELADVDAMIDKWVESEEALASLSRAQDRRNDAMARGAALTESLRTPQQEYNDRIEEAKELMEEGAISAATFNRALTDAKSDLEDALEGDWLDFGEALGDNMAQAVIHAENLGDVLDGVLATIVEIAAQELIADPLSDLISTGISAFGSYLGGGGVDLSGAKNLKAGFSPTKGLKFARGGVVPSMPQWFADGGMVGEGGRQEGIFPLIRTGDGDLGVKAVGAGGQPAKVEVHLHGFGEQPEVQQSKTSDGGQRIDVFMREQNRNAIISGQSDSAMKSRFGARPQVAGR